MKASGKMMCEAAKATNFTQTVLRTWASIWKINRTVRAFSHGKMVRCMMESGSRESSKVSESGRVSLDTHMSESGTRVRSMATVSTSGRTGTALKASSSMA